MLHLLNHQDRRMEKKIAFRATVFPTYSGVLFFPKKKCLFARMALSAGRQIHIHSLKPLQAESPFCPACLLQPIPAQRQPDLCGERPGQHARPEFIISGQAAHGVAASHVPAWTRRDLSCFASPSLTSC